LAATKGQQGISVMPAVRIHHTAWMPFNKQPLPGVTHGKSYGN
jgi:hypothetical protein